jgi:hypothetical protein
MRKMFGKDFTPAKIQMRLPGLVWGGIAMEAGLGRKRLFIAAPSRYFWATKILSHRAHSWCSSFSQLCCHSSHGLQRDTLFRSRVP